jgi:hypothetical protein
MGFWQDLTGETASDAANAAAADTYGKQRAATADLRNYGDAYASQFKDLATGYDPYKSAGTSAIQQLMAGLGLSKDPDAQAAFTASYRALPGYQAGLDTGSRAITGNAAARGMLNSGATLKGLQRYGSNYEDQRSGDYLSRLMTVGQGLLGQLQTRTGAYNGDMTSAGTIGQGQIAGANAEAAGSQNLLNAGLKLGGMALGAFGGMPSFGGSNATIADLYRSGSGNGPISSPF